MINFDSDICEKLLYCSANMSESTWPHVIAALAALTSAIAAAIAAAAGWYYSHKAKDETLKQASRETFDRMYGESFNAFYMEVDAQFQLLRTKLLSQQATQPQIAEITELARVMPTEKLKKVCTEIDPDNSTPLVKIAEGIEAEVSSLVGTVSMQNSGWYTAANDTVQRMQASLRQIRYQAYAIRSTFSPPTS
ncbi:MAG: hypothetical protein KKA05_10855 [Alphaproteobacteria bacterium]|nr:hypothetical protein [Alphaproteobacteria bacterium]MBU0860145.1 hypothetical protein [Alphaproteobacteria bacterium]